MNTRGTDAALATTAGRAEKLIRILAFTLIISVMNATMYNVALPTISKEFMLTNSQVSWIVTGYIIVYAIGSVTFGKLADMYRLKDLLTFGLIFFALGSVLGLFASDYWMVILGRVLQAAGASVIPATAMLIPVRYFPPETRGRALGVVSSGLALGTAIGPIIAGFITSTLNWRFLFCMSLLALITLPFFRKYLDDDKGKPSQTDLLGGALLAGTIGSLLLAVTNASLGWFLGGLALLALFVWRIRRAASPFIDPKLFTNRSYSIGLIISFLGSGVTFGIPFVTPLMLSTMNQMTPAWIGFVMFPGAICAALLSRRGGRLADEKGNAFVIAIAVSFIFIAFGLLSVMSGQSPLWLILLLIVGNVGQTFLQISMSNTISRTLDKSQAGVGMGLMMMINFIAGATATTLIGKVLDAKGSTAALNPLLLIPEAYLYSNVYLIIACLVVVVALLYYVQFGRSGTPRTVRS